MYTKSQTDNADVLVVALFTVSNKCPAENVGFRRRKKISISAK